LRLSYSAGLSIRKISAGTKISVGSIQNILKLATAGVERMVKKTGRKEPPFQEKKKGTAQFS
ncbi:MAG: hypothetical protein QX191_04900, partial [Methylococcaceae bacterium]